MPNAIEIERKLPVWHALSELFLDTELQAGGYECIARQLSAAGFSCEELWSILELEVAQAFAFNLDDIAGEWSPWSREEVLEIMSRRAPPRPMRWFGRRRLRRHLRDEWKKIAPLLAIEQPGSDAFGNDKS
ncbi:MAG: hypothetical protein JO276_12535 [Sphingomonadaceae bacterium]|nr:hypothetical protein [Sphingomonas sp.]MBV9883826.1 hypothetical protein [Sphingomonadaceae bacterium]